MTAKELLAEGKLAAAIEATNGEVRARPTDTAARRVLFDLLCYAGDLARAEKQLDALSRQITDEAALAWAAHDRGLLAAEKARTALFQSGGRPRFIEEPSPVIEAHLEALDHLRAGRTAEARAALDRADELTPAYRGRRGEEPFDSIQDADDLLAPILEVFTPAGYFWVAWEQVQHLEIPPPKTLRDLLWTPARLATFDGQLGEVFLPGLYPGSSASTDDQVRLGRATDWTEVGAGIIRGIGRKIILVGEEGPTLLELGTIQFEPPKGEPGPPPDTETPASGAF